ncbi:beta-N-acetylhexosaminidase [Duganella violaceipulchra]|uniref:beta-N-acetylhexosaminidase n=1 Tax=Duganella violaceipulchra TaxID=2849652 RepID=A0AA41H307_9BURK|nr:beta-N-acetylhexosaminidase [Duganella violaceicalia]MBV6319503.1 beta-N-acetylhexosaminidase [Duganella violaceicalia]MCP2006685.1 hexosaminidase [Duganella violaceicalia]
MHLQVLLSCCLGLMGAAQAQDIVPLPAQLQRNAGEFALTSATGIVADGSAQAEAQMLRDYLRPATGFELPVVTRDSANAIRLKLDKKATALGKEGYRLVSDGRGVTITAADPAGLFYGVQSLRQLLPADIYRKAEVRRRWQLPAVSIEDQPRFGWRGSHLDTARHFMPKSFVLKHIELLAQHKMNVFHWHLTDDQGWRIEIKRFPLLTRVGAWRSETQLTPRPGDPPGLRYDNQPHGGYYTQDDIREVVAYAAARHITVVPEIEMPGHALAAIAAYPELGNQPGKKLPVGREWGVFTQVFSPEDSTVRFLQQVMDEVLTLFPGQYIHVGGDECPKTEWAHSPAALARMKTLKLVPAATTLEDIQNYRDAQGKPVEHPALQQLQSWFIGQMDVYLAERGRRLIGWDEILEGGLAQGATVMSWRGEEGGLKAASAGHDVVMTPERDTYLDYAQVPADTPGYREPQGARAVNTLDHVYAYEPLPAAMPPGLAKHVLGSQAQLWTEYMQGPREVEYMAWPRLMAMAEALWTPKPLKDYGKFQQRLPSSLQRLDAQDVNYRTADGPHWPR